MERKYKFNWGLLGDVKEGRPNMGNQVKVEIYRLMQYTFRDVMEQTLGPEKTDELFYHAGKLAGGFFFQHVMEPTADINEFICQLQSTLKDYGIGILRVEKADMEEGELILTVSEDLDCSGLPEQDSEVCKYDEGFIAALLESFSGTPFFVKEVDCWCTGDRTCRFHAKAVKK
jgi:predicted hydrocarbon binding protein